ncbi:hypothetical protein ACHAW6_013563, partial [Cyclotella cf. meneghiniana]
PITKIDGQITQEDYTKLVQELCKTAASIPTSVGVNYTKLSGNVSFTHPTIPGACPAVLSNIAKVCTTERATHKLQLIEYSKVTGVDQGLHDLIKIAVPKEYLAVTTNKYTGLAHLTIQKYLHMLKAKAPS